MIARIYKPSRTAAQSGRFRTRKWHLSFEPESPTPVEPLMGYASSSDMRRQINLSFDSRESAISYARRNGIAYRVDDAHSRTVPNSSYADNFRPNRPIPWTH